MTTDVMDLFTKIRAGMDAQNWQMAGGLGEACYYRLPNQTNRVGCAIGVLMPDDCQTITSVCRMGLAAKKRLRYLGADVHTQRQILLDAGIDESLRDVARLIQSVHDGALSVVKWQEHFNLLESRFRSGEYTVDRHPDLWRDCR